MRKDYQEVAELQRSTASKDRDSELGSRLKNIGTILAMYGASKGLEKLNEYLNDGRMQIENREDVAEIKKNQEINTSWKEEREHSSEMKSLQKTNQSIASERGDTAISQNWQELKQNQIDSFGLNFLNKFALMFEGNNSLTDADTVLLHQLTQEVSSEAIAITTAKNDISFNVNEDVSDVAHYPSVTVSFIVDRNLRIYKIIRKIINKMKNYKTGRYGYKDDYMFKNMTLLVFDNYNNVTECHVFKEVVISGVGELGVTSGSSELKTTQVVFKYSDYEVY